MSRTKTEFYSSVISDKKNHSANENLRGVTKVGVYIQDGINEVHVGNASTFKNTTDDLLRTLPNHTIPSNNLQDQVVITAVDIRQTCRIFEVSLYFQNQ